MRILITGAKGFVGSNLAAALENIRQGKDRTHPELAIDQITCFDLDSPSAKLEEACSSCDFVFHLAGVNRPKDEGEFMKGNRDAALSLLEALKRHGNRCPVMLASSVQATLIGRYNGEYGRSKRAGEEAFFAYAEETGARVLVYRFPNVFGKWCRPSYNSAVATFCHNVAHDLDVTVTDPAIELELLYIDDLVREMLAALAGKEHRVEYDGIHPIPQEDGRYCAVPTTHRATLGEIVSLLRRFHDQPSNLVMPEIPENSFEKKLYSTYLSYLPKERIAFPLNMHVDARGSFTELMRTERCGQISVNVSKPGITKGQHWHQSKWEIFIVVSGHGLIEQRRIGSDEIVRLEVSSDKLQTVHMLPGYTHSITNLSSTEDLVTVMWANEPFDPNRPDTYYEEVSQ